MSPGHILLTLALAHIVIAMTPGPNFVLVLQSAVRERRLGLVAALGVWPAGLIWATLGLAGLGAVIAALPLAETALRLICGSYLLWLGFKSLRAGFSKNTERQDMSRAGISETLRAGFITNITNPKGIAYFLSIFTATGAFALPLGYKIFAVFMIPSISFCWYCAMTMLINSKMVKRGFAKASALLDRIAGGLMLAFGLKLLVQP